MSRDEKLVQNRLEVGIDLVDQWSATRHLQAWDDIIGHTLQVP